MATKAYVGLGDNQYIYAYYSLINFDNITYSSLLGFEIDFESLDNSSGYKHILNVGGTGTNTVLCLSTTSYSSTQDRSTLSFETSPVNSKIIVNNTKYVIRGTRHVVSYLVDPDEAQGVYTVDGTQVKTVSVDVTYSVNKVLGFLNNSLWDGSGGTDRKCKVNVYRLKLYYGTTLLLDLVPDVSNRFRDTLSGQYYDITRGQALQYNAGNSGSRNVSKIYVGVEGTSKKVTKGYVGVNGSAQLFYSDV
jgi:hypothetical protein